ncbi:hypothetical protein QYE76_007248 [Lolium multiflorum]|uniref:Uncharacterized protein n=1 Tax=Lolium multiflorum TaxID=4521 RepID=A0AAD8RXB1_LOLMU|nr:hypothetical protein QYE76_007248 [Lolium multiflorum]
MMPTMSDEVLLSRMEKGINNPLLPAGGAGKEDEAFTIVRLPSHIHETNKGLYEPRLVSIGPYHISSASTRAMQVHKWRFLRDFLLRGDHHRDGAEGRRLARLAVYIREVRKVEARARRCYGEPLDQLGSDDFVQMLVLDGCFILEFMLKYDAAVLDAYMQWVWIYIYYDLLLVENQLPFFVLAKLFSLSMGTVDAAVDRRRLLRLIFKFFSLHDPPGQDPAPGQFTVIYHLLHLQHQRMVMAPERPKLGRSARLTRQMSATVSRIFSSIRARMIGMATTTPLAIPCATALMELGVTFRENASPAGQFDVTFQDGTIVIPRQAINAGTRILMANVFALEQTKDWKEGVVTGYVVLMNALVSTAADVALLRRHGIFDNMLSSDDDAAAFFNRLGDCALFDPKTHRYARLFKDTNEYCDSRWNRYVGLFKRDHLRSPCSIINLLVAAMLLGVSVLSAGYTICRYRHGCS